MDRSARIERRVVVPLADGSTVTLGPGTCWVDEDAEKPVLTWLESGRRASSPVDEEALRERFLRMDFVYTSW